MESNSDFLEDFLKLNYKDSELTISEKITEQSGVIGEKIEISYFDKIVS